MVTRRSSVLAPLLFLVLIHLAGGTRGARVGGSAGAAAGGWSRVTTRRVSCADRADCTPELQAALYDGGTDHVVVPNDRGHLLWPSHQLLLNRSDVVLTLEPGVILQSVRCTVRDSRSCEGDSQTLLTVEGATNVTIRGPGASVRMWRADYVLNPFNLSGLKGIEARGAIGIYDSRGVTVSGLEIAESGGDGVCVVGCAGCELHNLTIDGAYRDAITVAACNGLLVDRCALLNTGAPGRYNGGEKLTTSNGGIAGACAVDVEPDSEGEAVLNLTFRDVRAAGNPGTAFNVHGDTNHSIRFERVHAFGGVHAGHSAFSFSVRASFRSAFEISCPGVCPCRARARCNHFLKTLRHATRCPDVWHCSA